MQQRRVVRSSAVVAVFALLSSAGCQSDELLTKGAYEKKVQAVGSDLIGALRATSTRLESAPKLAERIATVRGEISSAADQLDGLEPPMEIEENNHELVEALRDYTGELTRPLEAARKGNLSAVRRFNAALSSNESVNRIQETLEEMTRKGYDLGILAKD